MKKPDMKGGGYYNFCGRHRTLKGQTPAMASGLSDHVWTIKELLEKAASA